MGVLIFLDNSPRDGEEIGGDGRGGKRREATGLIRINLGNGKNCVSRIIIASCLIIFD